MGHRSSGGPPAQFGFRPPGAAELQKTLNAEILVIPMIETPQAVENADRIAALEGIDALLIGTNDLALEMGIAGQVGHERIGRPTRRSPTPAGDTRRCSAWAASTTRRWRAATSAWAPA